MKTKKEPKSSTHQSSSKDRQPKQYPGVLEKHENHYLGNPLKASFHSILLKELCAESSIFIDKESSKGSTFHVTDKMHTLATNK